MKNYGLTRAIDEPLSVEVKETKVFVASNVRRITVTDEAGEHTEYEFNLVEYDKNEYLHMMIEQNEILTECLLEVSEMIYA